MTHHTSLVRTLADTFVARIATLALAFIVLQPQHSSGAPVCAHGQPATISLTTNISDFDSSGLAADIASDGLGPYGDNVAGVTSFLTCNGYNGIPYGDWQFDTYSSTTRTVKESLDSDDEVLPGDPHYTAPANPPFLGTQSLKAHIEVKCTLINNDMQTMTAGSSFTCPLLNRFNVATSTTA